MGFQSAQANHRRHSPSKLDFLKEETSLKRRIIISESVVPDKHKDLVADKHASLAPLIVWTVKLSDKLLR